MRKRKVAVLRNQQDKWCIDFTDEFGKRRRMMVGDGTNEKAAKDAARAKAREINERLTTERNPDTASVSTVMAAFMEGNPAFDTAGILTRVGELTRMKYHAIYGHFKKFFPNEVSAFRELTKYHVEKYLATRAQEGAAPKTILAEFILFRTMIRWAAQEHQDGGRHFFLKYDITEGVKPPKQVEKLPVYFTDDELTKLFAAAAMDKTLRAIFALGYYHGLRTSSIARLKISDVTDGGTKFKVWKKNGGQIEFSLHADAATALRECVPASGSEYWFGDEWASEPNVLSEYLCAFIRRTLNVRKRFHDLRHTTAHAHILAGTSAPMLQQVLGHTNLGTTQHYVRLWEHETTHAADRLKTVGGH